MKIIEKLTQEISLTVKEQEKQKIIFSNYLADFKVVSNSLSDSKREQINKLLSLLLVYYPDNWRKTILKNLTGEAIEKMIKEESNFE